MKIVSLLVLPFIFCSACNEKTKTSAVQKESLSQNPNIILMIGDGMGVSQLSSLYYFKEEKIQIDRFSFTGFAKTSSAKQKITDSGASGTALSTGVKTYNGAIGVDADTNRIENIVELLSEKGYNTGIIATSTLTHATPASFFAHADSRSKEDYLASQMHNSEVDYFAGGGLKHFNKRKDGKNFLDSLKQNGFEIDTNQLSLLEEMDKDKKYGFLLKNGALPKKIDGRDDFLPRATTNATGFLSQKSEPFFLMVEGSQIDWGGHNNNHEYLSGEMIDFDDAIGKALDFAQKHGNTLVIVTADHETGGYTLRSGKNEEGNTDYNVLSPSFSTGGHSATMVPVLSYGKNADQFVGIYENTEIFKEIMKIVKD